MKLFLVLAALVSAPLALAGGLELAPGSRPASMFFSLPAAAAPAPIRLNPLVESFGRPVFNNTIRGSECSRYRNFESPPEDDRCQPTATPFGGGSGTPDDPYLVCSGLHLYNVRLAPEAHFAQSRTIDFGWTLTSSGRRSRLEVDWEAAGFRGPAPRFSPIPKLSGRYDGRCFSIKYLKLLFLPPNAYEKGPVALFAKVGRDAQILRVRLYSPEIHVNQTWNQPVGALAAINYGRIFHSSAEGGTVSKLTTDKAEPFHDRAGVGGLVGVNLGHLDRVSIGRPSTGTRMRIGDYSYGTNVETDELSAAGGIAGINFGQITSAIVANNLVDTINVSRSEPTRCCTTSYDSIPLSVVPGNTRGIGGIVGLNFKVVENIYSEWNKIMQRCFSFRNILEVSGSSEVKRVGGAIGLNSGPLAVLRSTQIESLLGVCGYSEVGGAVGLNSGGTVDRIALTRIQDRLNWNLVIGFGSGIGGLVGANQETGSIANSSVDRTLVLSVDSASHPSRNPTKSSVGGLVGTNDHSNILRSTAVVALEARRGIPVAAGGIAGTNDRGQISECGAVTNPEAIDTSRYRMVDSSEPRLRGMALHNGHAGGLIGENYGDLIDSFAHSQLTCADSSAPATGGGAVGLNAQLIRNVYAVWDAPTGCRTTGGLNGERLSSGITENSYWDAERSGVRESAGGTPRSSSELGEESSYIGWDFRLIWRLGSSGSESSLLPTLRRARGI